MAFRARKVFRTSETGLQIKKDEIENLCSSAHVVHTTAKHVISLRRHAKDDNSCEMYKN